MTRRSVWNRLFGRPSVGAGVLFALLAGSAGAVPVISAVATPSTALLGRTISVDVMVSGAVDLYAYQFSMAFNPNVLQVTSITEGSFLASAGSTFWDGGTVDNAAGTILNGFDSLLGSAAGKSGSGLLERIVFTVKGGGTSTIGFSDLQFLNSGFTDLGATSISTSVVGTVPEPASAALLGLGLAALGVAGRLGRRRTTPVAA